MKCPLCSKRLSLTLKPSFTVTTFKCNSCNSLYEAKFKTIWGDLLLYIVFISFSASIVYWGDKNFGLGFYVCIIIFVLMIITALLGSELVARLGVVSRVEKNSNL